MFVDLAVGQPLPVEGAACGGAERYSGLRFIRPGNFFALTQSVLLTLDPGPVRICAH